MSGDEQDHLNGKPNPCESRHSQCISDTLRGMLDIDDVEDLKCRSERLIASLSECKTPGSDGNYDPIIRDLKQIRDSMTKERAHYYIRRLIKGLTVKKNASVSDINLNRWKDYADILTDSLWTLDRRDSSGVHNAGYWGNFIPQIPYQLMQRFTKKGDTVLDLFLGSGTTLIECQRLGRNGIGFDLSPEAVKLSMENVKSEENPYGVVLRSVEADSTKADYSAEIRKAGLDSAQLVIMHPPYWDIIQFSSNDGDLSNSSSMETFLEGISSCAAKSYEVLDQERYLALVIGDKYSKGEWIPLGFRSMDAVLQKGFRLKSIIVKNFDQTRGKQKQKGLWRYRALAGGFYVFKHEYIFLFQKD